MKREEAVPWSTRCILVLLVAGLASFSPGNCETFSFAVLADPHIDGNPEHEACLEAAVRWIINNKNFKDIELVFIVGDIAWGYSPGSSNVVVAKEILDELNDVGIPYVPLQGDNEVHSGFEEEFDYVFGEQYHYLSEIVENWQQAPTPVAAMYLQNFSFDYKGCHFVCPDFVSRAPGQERGELHDFAGGSWPWFTNDIANCAKPKQENVVVLTHIGMFRTGVPAADQYLYTESDLLAITDFLSPYQDHVATNYAGHIHQNWYWAVPSSGEPIYDVYVTDETWYDARWPEPDDNEITVRWVRVNDSGPTVHYTQQTANAPIVPQTLPVATYTVLLLMVGCIAACGALRAAGHGA